VTVMPEISLVRKVPYDGSDLESLSEGHPAFRSRHTQGDVRLLPPSGFLFVQTADGWLVKTCRRLYG
jgi:hypothetical protein